ncbi:MAG: transporter associated domain-containing protein [Caldilineaceae bacterium]
MKTSIRYPVYQEDRDHIVGVLHLKDLARGLHEKMNSTNEPFDGSLSPVQAWMRPAFFVPETLALEQMLDHFRQEHIQIAIAVDEFGGTAGLITLEDLAEEIIGEIQDESDFEIPPFIEIQPRLLRVRGDLLLDELNQHYELDLAHAEAETVGGLIMDALGHMASVGETVDYAGTRFEVESMEGLAVNTALLYLPPIPEESPSEQAQVLPIANARAEEDTDRSDSSPHMLSAENVVAPMATKADEQERQRPSNE